MLAGLRVIESLHLVEDGEPIQVQNTVIMHPETVRVLKHTL